MTEIRSFSKTFNSDSSFVLFAENKWSSWFLSGIFTEKYKIKLIFKISFKIQTFSMADVRLPFGSYQADNYNQNKGEHIAHVMIYQDIDNL